MGQHFHPHDVVIRNSQFPNYLFHLRGHDCVVSTEIILSVCLVRNHGDWSVAPPNQRMNSEATLALRAKTGCAGYAGTLGVKGEWHG